MTIVCAIDGSRYSQWALEWPRRLCEPAETSLLLVHAVDLTQYKGLARKDRNARAALVKALELSLEGAARLLERAEARAAATWPKVHAKLLRGRPAEAIARAAEREQADLLVVGSRGVTEFQPMLVGSVSRKLLLQAPCPTLVVKNSPRPLKRVVLGVDGSVESWEAASWLSALPRMIRPSVTVASVIPPLPLESIRVPARAVAVGNQVEGTLRREAQKLAARVAGTLRQAGFPANAMVLAGAPGAELVKLAACEKADLIAVGSRSGRRSQEYFLGSVADAVVKYAPTSVLVYRR
jgi:nucleotide-binding universal stress UspA family protein